MCFDDRVGEKALPTLTDLRFLIVDFGGILEAGSPFVQQHFFNILLNHVIIDLILLVF